MFASNSSSEVRKSIGVVAPSVYGLFLSALAGAMLVYWLGAPMPFLLGGVLGSSLFVVAYERSGNTVSKPKRFIRQAAIASIGAMIGSNVPPELIDVLPSFWISGLAVLPFILIALAGNYAIFKHIGGYKPVDAYFSALPGGLIDAVLLGEKAGADVRVITIQQFIRLLSVVVAVPFLFFISTGEVVGSASGTSFSTADYGYVDITTILVIGFVGLILGNLLKMPASHLLGPLLLAIGLTVSETVSITVPPWMLHAAQYFIGATLGAQFSGMNLSLLRRGLSMGALSVPFMLCVGYLFATALSLIVPAEVPALFISFAAGGVAEMSLIALSLELSPVIVALHHLVRIFLVILTGRYLYNRLFNPSSAS